MKRFPYGDFLGAAFLTGAFLTAAFLTGAFLTAAFLTGAFFAAVFFAAVFLAAVFLVVFLLVGAFVLHLLTRPACLTWAGIAPRGSEPANTLNPVGSETVGVV